MSRRKHLHLAQYRTSRKALVKLWEEGELLAKLQAHQQVYREARAQAKNCLSKILKENLSLTLNPLFSLSKLNHIYIYTHMHDLLDNVTVWGLKVENDSVLTVHVFGITVWETIVFQIWAHTPTQMIVSVQS